MWLSSDCLVFFENYLRLYKHNERLRTCSGVTSSSQKQSTADMRTVVGEQHSLETVKNSLTWRSVGRVFWMRCLKKTALLCNRVYGKLSFREVMWIPQKVSPMRVLLNNLESLLSNWCVSLFRRCESKQIFSPILNISVRLTRLKYVCQVSMRGFFCNSVQFASVFHLIVTKMSSAQIVELIHGRCDANFTANIQLTS